MSTLYTLRSPTARATVVAQNLDDAYQVLHRSGANDYGPFALVSGIPVPTQRSWIITLMRGLR